VELFALLAEARDRGVQAVAMEVSSHALSQRRVDGVEFDAAVFTNLTQDHLDYHQTMAAYEAAKYRLFTELPRQSTKTFLGALNVGVPVGRRWAESGNFLTYAVDPSSRVDLAGRVRSVGLDRIELALKMEGQTNASAIAPLGGTYNVENLVSAAAGVYALGQASNLWGESPSNLSVIAELMGRVRPVPGRFEAVPNDAGIGVIVDYAHTPDALEKVLDAIRPLTPGRVITVFGCGGDRDRTKRPKMARSASLRSDLTVITSDNPRTEDPAAILAEVQLGVADGRASVSIVDRGEAVAHAVAKARPGDVVVIAGKGHENYQIIGRTKFPMDDRDLARRALEARR
jgi:UDP-N-acetylmuramyl-tripeptide synthetase